MKLIKYFLILFLSIICMIQPNSIHAQSDTLVVDSLHVNYTWNSASGIKGLHKLNGIFGIININGERGFCIDPAVYAVEGEGYIGQAIAKDNSSLQYIAKVAIANDYKNMDANTYIAFQVWVWQVLHPDLIISTPASIDFTNLNKQFINNYQSYWTAPSLEGQDTTIKANETKQFKLSKGSLKQWSITSTTPLTTATIIDDTTLQVTNQNFNDTTLQFSMRKNLGSYQKVSVAYSKPNAQQLATFGIEESFETKITLINQFKGDLEITKIDELNRKIEGVSFTLSYHQDMSQPIGTYTTDANGKIVVKDLIAKTVYYKEVSAPDAFLMNTQVESVMITPATTTPVRVSNTIKKGCFSITKIKDSGVSGVHDYEAGAVFNVIDEHGDIVDILTTDSNGYAKSKLLYYGTYIVKQMKAYPGYELAKPFVVNIHLNQDTPQANLTITNNILQAKLKILKKDDNNHDVLMDGATFKILDQNENVVRFKIGDTYVEELTTINGSITTPTSLPMGQYYIEEVRAPEGYTRNQSKYPFTIAADSEFVVDDDNELYIYVDILNQRQYANLELTKTFEASNLMKYAGYALYNGELPLISPQTHEVVYEANEQILNPNSEDGLWYVFENAPLYIESLPIGKGITTYHLKEIVASEGYVVDSMIHTFTFDERDDNKTSFTKTSHAYNALIRETLTLTKIDALTKQPVATSEGFEFTMYADPECQHMLKQVTLDETTKQAKIDDIAYGSTIYIKETKTNLNYFKNDTVYIFHFTKETPLPLEIVIENTPIPSLQTKAMNDKQEKIIDPSIRQQLIDVLSFEQIDTSKSYILVSELRHSESDELILSKQSDGITFEESTAMFGIHFDVDANTIVEEGKYYFAQYLYDTTQDLEHDEPLLYHKDVNNQEQTIELKKQAYQIHVHKEDFTSKKAITRDFSFEVTFYTGNLVSKQQIFHNEQEGMFTIHFDGHYDRIEIKEVIPPDGYKLSQAITTITMDQFNETHELDITVYNERIPQVIQTFDTTNTYYYLLLLLVALHLFRLNRKYTS